MGTVPGKSLAMGKAIAWRRGLIDGPHCRAPGPTIPTVREISPWPRRTGSSETSPSTATYLASQRWVVATRRLAWRCEMGTRLRGRGITRRRATTWSDWITNADLCHEFVLVGGSDLSAGGRVVDLGVAVLGVKRFRPIQLQRNAGPVCTGDEDIVQLVVPMRGTVNATWAGRQDSVSVGDLYVHDLARLDEVSLQSGGRADALELALVAIPKPVLPLRGDAMDMVLGHGLPVDGGVSGLLKRFIEDLSDEKLSLTPADRQRLGMVLVDLVTACLSSLLESGPGPRPGSQRQALALRIRTYIQRHLHDSELTPGSVAAANHISVSYLHRLFQEQGDTVSAWIRDQRLERTRRDLANAALIEVPIHEIATRWGFGRAGDFSRVFRRAYGVTPREFRSSLTGT
ncbi:AraC family transcriptional regulator [Nonomuraea sp. NPDC046802]|uniref:AraC family transcriptional regulator n=1 Tax=Nonomuraea sp. NPDC046802 TaxID=3154919 RepID=UPI003409AE33